MDLTMIDLEMVAKIAPIVQEAAAKIAEITGKPTNLKIQDAPPTKKLVSDEVRASVIIEYTANKFGVTPIDMKSKSKKHPLPDARGVAMIAMKKYTKLSLKGIGAQLGGRDHSTVLHRIKGVKNVALYEKELRHKIEDVIIQIESLNIYVEPTTNNQTAEEQPSPLKAS